MKNYLKEISKFKTPDFEDYLEYYKSKNEKLRDKIIKGNLQLVHQQGKKYKKYLNSDLFEDVIFEGNLGLIKAIDKFNPTKGYKFSTYASFWIVESMISFMKKNSNMIDNTLSLDNIYTNLDEDNQSNMIDLLDNEQPNTEKLDTYFFNKQIKKFKKILTIREYDIICHYYGVDSHKEMTIPEIAKLLDYSNETIRLVKESALAKIKKKYTKNDF